ncbi:MAG: hypothetical protein ACLP8X_34130 [Streptosporangiaceae bacterium]
MSLFEGGSGKAGGDDADEVGAAEDVLDPPVACVLATNPADGQP